MKSAVVILLLFSVGFVSFLIVEVVGQTAIVSVNRQLTYLQTELNGQRLEMAKLRTDVQTLKYDKTKQESETGRLKTELERQKLENNGQRAELDKLQSTVHKLNNMQCSKSGKAIATGSSYIRWGRTTCNAEAAAVYAGHVAGPHQDRGGGGSNLLCIHESPQYNRLYNGTVYAGGQWIGAIYGVETDFFTAYGIFSSVNNNGASLDDKPGACAQCYIPTRSTVITIPARTACPAGWTVEYRGYMVSESSVYSRHRSSYVCWDEAPETRSGGSNQNNGVVYPVEIRCGSLPCSTYTNGHELTCVVCSK